MVSKILSGESKKFDESAVKYGDENHETKQNSTIGMIQSLVLCLVKLQMWLAFNHPQLLNTTTTI